MEKVIKVLNEMKKRKLIEDYAIGGGIAAIFYAETILTYDLDIFFISSSAQEGKLITLSPIYDYFKDKGCRIDKEHIIIEGMPVQFIPVYNELVKEAVENAREIKYKGTKTKVLRAEYLISIMLQTFRPKDKERIIRLLDESKIDENYLKGILKKFKLDEKFESFKKVYYEK